jgi:hypothetical protein
VSEAADQPDTAPPGIDEHGPPWNGGPTITVSQLEFLRLRFSREDYKQLIIALKEHGALSVVADP